MRLAPEIAAAIAVSAQAWAESGSALALVIRKTSDGVVCEQGGAVAAPMATTADVLTRAEAMAYVKRNSPAAFCEWCQKWGVKAASRGRYSRQRLDIAIDKEARRRAA